MPPNIAPPIVVDLGEIAHADIERLRGGSGQIAEDVQEVMRLLNVRAEGSDRVFLPLVMLYNKQRKIK